jgi:tetratricopeptide (TPR) repeat protein
MANNKSSSIWISPPVLILLLILTNVASAENVTFIKEYTYMASDIDSKVSSRAIALEQVKRALLDQLGTYLISETEVKNYQITKDQVTTLTAGIVSAEIVDEKWDGRTYYLKAKIAADPKEIAKSVDALKNDVQKSKELSDSKKMAGEAMREVERLKTELELVKSDPKKQGEYASAIKNLTAADWFDKGFALFLSGNLQASINAYDNAIKMNPQDAKAYSYRGGSYLNFGNMPQAIRDFDKAVELSPQDAGAYYNRGSAYHVLKNEQQSIKDLDKAIELNPQFEQAYNNRGAVYYALGNERQAIKDLSRSIDLNPDSAQTFKNRGVAHDALGNMHQAIKDYNKAIELSPQNAETYYYRGLVYDKS